MRPVNPAELAIGQPLVASVYDKGGKLLLAAGQIVRSESQLELLSGGFYGASSAGGARPAARPPAPPAHVPRAPEPEKSKDSILISSQRGGNLNADPEAPVARSARVKLGSNPGNFVVQVIGVVPGQSVLVTFPREHGRPALVKEGESISVRGLFGKSVYAFEGTVMKVCVQPFPYLHLRWHQGRMEKVAVRNTRRAPCLMQAAAVIAGDGGEKFVECKLHDLSLGGAQLSANTQLPEKFQLRFELEVLGVKHAFDVETQIRKRKDNGEEPGVLRYGVTFAELPPAQQLALHAWIGDELVQRYECPFMDAT